MPRREPPLEGTRLLSVVVSCEHASWRLPPEVGDLGVAEAALRSHASWDPGAAELARELGARLGVEPFLGRWSRLLVDLNRTATNPGVVPETSFGLAVPGNRGISPAARSERLERYHAPYHAAVREAVLRSASPENPCVHLAAHSFTPEMGDARRGFDVGILFDPSRALEVRIAEDGLRALRAAGLDARPNEPYEGIADAVTAALRLELPDPTYAGIEIEISQASLEATARVAEAIAATIRARTSRRWTA